MILTFDEETHSYTINGKPSISVTQLISKLSNPVDIEYWAEIKAPKYGKTKEQVLKEWRLKNHLSKTKGHIVHDLIESKLLGKETNIHKYKNSLVVNNLIRIIEPQIDNVVKYINNLYEDIELEFRVADEELLICGTVDFLGTNKLTGLKDLIDWKSNTDLKLKSIYKLKNPLFFLDDSDLTKYSLQLNLYEFLLKRNRDNFEIGNKQLIHFSELNSKPMIHDAFKLQNEIKYIIDNINKF